jgi:hypothetical protein
MKKGRRCKLCGRRKEMCYVDQNSSGRWDIIWLCFECAVNLGFECNTGMEVDEEKIYKCKCGRIFLRENYYMKECFFCWLSKQEPINKIKYGQQIL